VRRTTRYCQLGKILAEQPGIEVVTVANDEREVVRRLRTFALINQQTVDEKIVGLRVDIEPEPPRAAVGDKCALGKVICAKLMPSL
jgi:hypothetical protein